MSHPPNGVADFDDLDDLRVGRKILFGAVAIFAVDFFVAGRRRADLERPASVAKNRDLVAYGNFGECRQNNEVRDAVGDGRDCNPCNTWLNQAGRFAAAVRRDGLRSA